MKKNALASLALAFATAFALADGATYLGTPTKVGSLSRSTDYVYEAGEVDTLLGARVPATRKVNGHALTNDISVTAADVGVEAGAQVNVIESVKVPDGNALTVSAKSVTLPSATASVDGLVRLVDTYSGSESAATSRAASPAAVRAALAAAATIATNLSTAATGASVSKTSLSAALAAQGISSADNLDDMDAIAAQIAKIVAVLEALD